jgi:predicted CoA-substrate-specific enzyme activase
MIYAGIDAGSRAVKVALYDGEREEVVATAVRDQGVEQDALARRLLGDLLTERGLAERDVRRTIVTGYGRNLLAFADRKVTEITCHAEGVRRLAPGARTVVEIGGQDSKVIRLAEGGSVRDFSMNDRCAAGTGRFLEVVAVRLGIRLEDLGALAGRSLRPAAISSMCVVFAETEIISLLASGTSREDIVAGVQASIASRTAALVGRQALEPVIFTGGVALVPGMKEALEAAVKRPVRIPPDPQFTGALGAAILASREA